MLCDSEAHGEALLSASLAYCRCITVGVWHSLAAKRRYLITVRLSVRLPPLFFSDPVGQNGEEFEGQLGMRGDLKQERHGSQTRFSKLSVSGH
jgi:hypothetical protein